MDAGRRAADLLERRPELEDALRAVLDVDADRDGWTFDDVPVDSGAFGEIVAAGVVEDGEGDEYRVADPEAVRRVLSDPEGALLDESDDTGLGTRLETLRSSVIGVDTGFVALLTGVFGFFVIVRSYHVGSVFRGRHVVLLGNDPYYYRYLVESLLESGATRGPAFWNMPSGASTGEPLLVASLGTASQIAGAEAASGLLVAVYPVLAGLVTAGLLYLLAVRVTQDRRVGVAAVAMLAIVPAYAFRTSLGYADHHAFDYLWLVLTALALTALLDRDTASDLRQNGTWIPVGGLAFGIGGQVLAWDGGPLVLVPVGLVVVAVGLAAVRAGHSPLQRLAVPVVALWLGALLTLAGHGLLGWQSTTIAAAPLLVAVGATGVAGASEVAHRMQRSAPELLLVETFLTGVGLVVTWLALPPVWEGLVRIFGVVTRLGTTAEAQALFSGAGLGFLLLFGPFLLLLTVAFLLWGTDRVVDGDDSLLVPCTYAWFFLLLSLFQVRFVGELAPFAALFSGLGLVWLAAWVDLGPLPAPFADGDGSLRAWVPGRPQPRTIVYVLALFTLVAGIGLVQSAIKIDQLTYDEGAYRSAAWIEGAAEDRGLEGREEAYVFSLWDMNRMFNYFANGEAGGYGYARNNFGEFLVETNPEEAYRSIRGRVAFLVTLERGADPPTMQSLLHDRHGSADGIRSGTGHFRAGFASENGDYKVFEPVEGAVLSGAGTANASVSARTDVSIPGASFTYERTTTTNASGRFSLRVAYEGTYSVVVDGRTQEVVVSSAAVEAGEQIRVGS